jgi:aryl-alcohol dehydrogenase-like predicted oxidoreductase
MNNRKYGRLDARVSEIGLGGHREGMEWHDDLGQRSPYYRSPEERARLVEQAIDRGVNYFDSSVGWELVSIGESLRLLGRREGLFVSGCKVDFYRHLLREGADPREYARRWFETHRRASGLGYLDQYLLGALDADDPFSGSIGQLDEAVDEMMNIRDEGQARSIAFSAHDPDYAARLLERYPNFDAVMTPYSFSNRKAEGKLAAVLTRTGAAWIAMKTLINLLYGVPITTLRCFQAIPGVPDFSPEIPIAQLAHRFVLGHPSITTCVPAMNSTAEVAENTAASGMEPLSPVEIRQLEICQAAAEHEDSAYLLLGGLFADTARTRCHALWHLRRNFDIAFTPFRLDAPDAVLQIDRAVHEALAAARAHPRLSAYLVSCTVEV